MNKLPFSVFAMILLAAVQTAGADDRLREVIASDHRPAEQSARDAHRHPYETLTFFGIAPDMTVVELFPGGGWYSEILAPYLAGEGKLVAAHFNLEREDPPGYYEPLLTGYRERFSDTDRYGEVEILAFDPPELSSLGAPGSADMVLTFRNVHGWMGAGTLDEVFAAAAEVLRPGGILGVVGHRLPEDREQDPQADSGYVKQSWVVARAEANGFRLEAASEVNANPADTADHPEGVWTLPPSLRVPEGQDEAPYREIGESDRFTLKFVKR